MSGLFFAHFKPKIMQVFVGESHLGLGNTEDLALDLATVDADEVDFGRCLDELGVLGHDGDDGLGHVAVVVDGEALVSADVGGREPVDLQLDDAVPAVVARELLTLRVDMNEWL